MFNLAFRHLHNECLGTIAQLTLPRTTEFGAKSSTCCRSQRRTADFSFGNVAEKFLRCRCTSIDLTDLVEELAIKKHSTSLNGHGRNCCLRWWSNRHCWRLQTSICFCFFYDFISVVHRSFLKRIVDWFNWLLHAVLWTWNAVKWLKTKMVWKKEHATRFT